MADVMSQEEIDRLLNQISSGEFDIEEMKNQPEKQVKNYDFARPSKFSKEHLRTLEIIFEHYSRLLSTELPAYMRKQCTVEVINSEVVIYSEFSNALSNPVLLGVINFEPLKGNVIMEIGANLGYAIIDRLLGGSGAALEKNRDFSEIELTILERIFTICVNILREPWKNVIEINPRLERIETNCQFAQIISPSETIAIITMSVVIGDVDGLMNICLPYSCIEGVMDKLNTKYWFSQSVERTDESYEKNIEYLISKSVVPVKAILGKSTISIEDFANIQAGDIIKLDRPVDQELDIYVGDIRKFTAMPGASDGNNAVRITDIIRGEE